jgi:hypothetical protein
MTPSGSYVWLNPRFFKLLKPAKNPLPSSQEEMDNIWKATGRTKILGEAPEVEEAVPPEEPAVAAAPPVAEEAAAPPEEAKERLCSTCGGPLDYIGEYDAWYCSACGKYDEELQEEGAPLDDTPPQDEQFPPPDEDFPPPDELPPPV